MVYHLLKVRQPGLPRYIEAKESPGLFLPAERTSYPSKPVKKVRSLVYVD